MGKKGAFSSFCLFAWTDLGERLAFDTVYRSRIETAKKERWGKIILIPPPVRAFFVLFPLSPLALFCHLASAPCSAKNKAMHPAVMGGVGGQMVSHSSGVPYRMGSWRKGGGKRKWFLSAANGGVKKWASRKKCGKK